MWAWWQRRVALKRAREAVKNTRKLLRMHRDIVSPADLAAANAATENLANAVTSQNASAFNSLLEKLEEKLGRAFPRQPYAALRENGDTGGITRGSTAIPRHPQERWQQTGKPGRLPVRASDR